jgi:hypothetical protein
MEDLHLKFELKVIPVRGFINFELHINNFSDVNYFFKSALLQLDNDTYDDNQEFRIYCKELIPENLPPYHLKASDNLLISIQVEAGVKDFLKKVYSQNNERTISMLIGYGLNETDLGNLRKSDEISVKEIIDKIEAM